MADRIKFGSTLHVHFTEVNPEEGWMRDLGELVVEPNPASADRFPGMVSSFIASFRDAQTEETFGARVIGFELKRTFLDLAGEAMTRLGFLKQ
jgi:hypothetical protein